MEMCFCDYLLCIIPSICASHFILKFFIISSSFFFAGILNSWLIIKKAILHISSDRDDQRIFSGFEIKFFDFGISFW